MKKAYNAPKLEVTEFRFSEHIASSGVVNDCYWGSSASWTHKDVGCETNYTTGTPGWIGLNG